MTRARSLVLLGALACGATIPRAEPRPARIERVLFIGNSLTYANDLPGTLAALAATAGDSIEVRTVAAPNMALIDHLAPNGAAIEAIRSRRWDLVVLQQGPTTRPVDGDTLVIAVRRLNAFIRGSGARAALLMVWPPAARSTAFDSVAASCQRAARAVGAPCVPAGEAWRAALGGQPPLPVYGADGFHPSEVGTYLAALVLYETVTGRDARSLPADARTIHGVLPLDEAIVRRLQRIAHETHERYPSGR
jgi:hypothetical protein